MRTKIRMRPCECQDDRHHSQSPRGDGTPNHEYMAERDDVILGSGFTLSRCYYCRVHHGPTATDPR